MKSLAAILDMLWLKLSYSRNAKGQLRLNEKSVFVVAVANVVVVVAVVVIVVDAVVVIVVDVFFFL